jgi:hypothetical protein
MDELQGSDLTPTSQTENLFFTTVLSRQNSTSGDTELDNQVQMA